MLKTIAWLVLPGVCRSVVCVRNMINSKNYSRVSISILFFCQVPRDESALIIFQGLCLRAKVTGSIFSTVAIVLLLQLNSGEASILNRIQSSPTGPRGISMRSFDKNRSKLEKYLNEQDCNLRSDYD